MSGLCLKMIPLFYWILNTFYVIINIKVHAKLFGNDFWWVSFNSLFFKAGSFRITSTHCMSYHCAFSSDLLYFLLMAHAQILN